MINRKFIFFLVLMFAGLFLSACNSIPGGKTDELIEEVHAWIEETVKEGVAEDITLPTTYPDNDQVQIEWFSTDPDYIDDEGHIITRDRKAYEVYFLYNISVGDKKVEYEKMFKLSPRSLAECELRFTDQFSVFISRDIDLTTVFYDVVTITWWSSNTDVFTNEGKYIKPILDTNIIISYIVSDGNNSLENSFEIMVQGKTAYDYFLEAQEWLENGFIQDRFITEDMDLPSFVGNNENVKLTWVSSNEDIITNEGKITKTIYERYVKLTARLEVDGSVATYDYNLTVEALDISSMSDQELLEEFVSNIAVSEYKKLTFNTYADNTQSYGFIHFYGAKKLNVIEGIITNEHGNRPGEIQKKEFIVVHDTANNAESATAELHQRYVANGGDGTSWHYSIDENNAYHHIPDNEVAYHAGDGARYFKLEDTGIKATALKPMLSMKDGYYYINGQYTGLRPYTDAPGTKFDPTNWTTDDINKMGILVEIGENGNWWMNKTWYSDAYDYIGNFGGNRNGVGIESCVNKGSDYATTARHLAILVAKLLIDWDLPVDRVKGHHFFSGKGCPNQIMQANWWEEFLNLVALEKFAKEHFADYTFTWTSLSNTVDSTGKISLSANVGDKISYKVSVANKSNVEVLNETYTTTLK